MQKNQDQKDLGKTEKNQKLAPLTRIPPTTAGRGLDIEIAERVMGYRRTRTFLAAYPRYYLEPDAEYNESCPSFSTDISAAWLVVERIQTTYPGWRFSLLGGDQRWGYRRGDKDDYVVVKSLSSSFGWSAEFFGEQDPTIDYGSRHGQAHHIETPALAICLAALSAVASVSSPTGLQEK